MKLFTYGSLTSRRRLEELVGRGLPDPQPGILRGYKVYHSPPMGYMLMLPADGGEIHGLVWDLKEEDLPVLDHYEGSDDDPPLYIRQTVEVEVGGELVQASAYVGNPAAWPEDRLVQDSP